MCGGVGERRGEGVRERERGRVRESVRERICVSERELTACGGASRFLADGREASLLSRACSVASVYVVSVGLYLVIVGILAVIVGIRLVIPRSKSSKTNACSWCRFLADGHEASLVSRAALLRPSPLDKATFSFTEVCFSAFHFFFITLKPGFE